MERARNWGDDRNKGWCVHCGGSRESVDHNPSRVFLAEPLPPDLPTSPACLACNTGFSDDEAYLACVLECAATGRCDPDDLERGKIAALLRRDANLMRLVRSQRGDTPAGPAWRVSRARIARVVAKLARGHAAFEANEPQLTEPSLVWFAPLLTLTAEQRGAFEGSLPGADIRPEVGSRAFNRLKVVAGTVYRDGWLMVQEGRHRYAVGQSPGLWVRLVIREYLACEVAWDG